MNYEKPTLILAGKAADVILGIFDLGADLDGSIVHGGAEFEPDLPFSETPGGGL